MRESHFSIFLSIVILDQKVSEPEKKIIKKIDTKDICFFGKDAKILIKILQLYILMYLFDLTLMIFTFFSFQEIPRSHLKCSSILGSLAKRPREDQLILVSICVSAALTLGLIVFVAVHCRRQMKSCFDPRGLVSIENNTPNHGLRTPERAFF